MTKISHFKIGLLFLTFVFLVVGALFWIGGTDYFQETKTYVSYFDHSVKGLTTSSRVKYLGLNVGQIETLELAPSDRKLVRVVMKLDPGFEVKKSMVVQQNIKGITGQSYLAIVEAPPELESVTPKIDFELKHPIIPSVPGQIDQVQKALAQIYRKIESVDIQGLLTEWEQVARNTNDLIDQNKINLALENIWKFSQDIRIVSQRVQKITATLDEPGTAQDLNQTFTDLAKSAESAREISKSLEDQIGSLKPGSFSQISQSLNRTISSFETSVRSANYQLTKTLNQFQESINQLNQVFYEIQFLARSLRKQPGRILNRPEEREPFSK